MTPAGPAVLLKVPGAENRKSGCAASRGPNGVWSGKIGFFPLVPEKASDSAHFHMPTSKIGPGAISGGPAEESVLVPNGPHRPNQYLGGSLIRAVS